MTKDEEKALTEEVGKLVSENMSLKQELESLQSANKYIQDELDKFKNWNVTLHIQVEDMRQMLTRERQKRTWAKEKYKNLKLKIANLLIK